MGKPSLSLNLVASKFPDEELGFIKTDVQQYMQVFYASTKWLEEDNPLFFEALTTTPYDNFLLIPPSQKAASDLTEPALKAWEMALVPGPRIRIDHCTLPEHRDHEHLLPFHMNNIDLLEHYEEVMEEGNEMEKEAVQNDFVTLKCIKDSTTPTDHHGTKFHCLGLPFSPAEYREVALAERLYFSLKEYLPNHIKPHPAYNYRSAFASLQEVFSSLPTCKFYFFRAVPDIIFSKSVTREASDAVFIENQLLELKPGGRLAYTKLSEVPNAFSQIVAGLHFLATARIIKAIRKQENVTKVVSKGLLINVKNAMTFITLTATVGTLCHSQMSLTYSDAKFHKNELALAVVCQGIKSLSL